MGKVQPSRTLSESLVIIICIFTNEVGNIIPNSTFWVDKPFPTTKRGWFLQASGWGNPYKFASTKSLGQSYSKKFPWGAIGIDSVALCDSEFVKIEFLGWEACKESLCGDGQGHCENDAECKPGLFCFQRESGETISGVK